MNEMNLSTCSKRSLDYGVEFLGETSSLITYAALSTHFGVIEGSVNTTSQANKWLQFKIDDKELYISKVAIRNNLSWDHLYNRGLVYGVNNNGLSPTTTPTNQYRTITLNGKLYKCRLLKGANEDQNPYTHIPGVELADYDPPNTYTSEWSRLFYSIITNDPYAKSYTGPMLANYVEADLQMRWIGLSATPGTYNWCQETPLSETNSRLTRGRNGPSFLINSTGSGIYATHGWRACLELIEP